MADIRTMYEVGLNDFLRLYFTELYSDCLIGLINDDLYCIKHVVLNEIKRIDLTLFGTAYLKGKHHVLVYIS